MSYPYFSLFATFETSGLDINCSGALSVTEVKQAFAEAGTWPLCYSAVNSTSLHIVIVIITIVFIIQ